MEGQGEAAGVRPRGHELMDEPGDARLWAWALVGSLLANGLIVLFLGWSALAGWVVPEPERRLPESEEATIVIVPVVPERVPAADPEKRRFARTSPEQAAESPEKARFFGERDTRAASERAAVANGPEVPSQAGEEAEFAEVETTRSRFQDGDLRHRAVGSAVSPQPPSPADPAPPLPADAKEAALAVESGRSSEASEAADSEEAGTDQAGPRTREPKAAIERLAQGPLTVERPVRPTDRVEEAPKPAPGREQPRPGEGERSAEVVVEQPKRAVRPLVDPTMPGFRGNQRRTELKGSISRRGRSSLDVQDSVLGRYHAEVSRAIEREWLRKCLQHRDYITPGVIRVRVVLDGEGQVRSVGTVEEFGIGTIQKGFTHGAIREAPMPAMPGELKRELQGEPLELLYNFIF